MANILLVAALIVEMAFVAYCIITKSRHSEARNWIRVGALVAFVLLMLLSVIQWSINWFGLGLLLVIWAALSGWDLLRAKAHTNEFKAWIIIRDVAAACPCSGSRIHLSPVQAGAHDRHPSGGNSQLLVYRPEPHRVLHEYGRAPPSQRRVLVSCRWEGQVSAGRVRHGSLGTKRQNYSTYMELASNGYVVCAIDHPFIAMFTTGADWRPVLYSQDFARELVDVNAGKYDAATAFQIEKKWLIVPVGDINFALDTILANARDPASGKVYQLVDPTKIGLMGYSLGGESAAQSCHGTVCV